MHIIIARKIFLTTNAIVANRETRYKYLTTYVFVSVIKDDYFMRVVKNLQNDAVKTFRQKKVETLTFNLRIHHRNR